MEDILKDSVDKINEDPDAIKNQFIVLETPTDKIYLSVKRLLLREVHDAMKSNYPKEKCQLLNICVRRKKRKRSSY